MDVYDMVEEGNELRRENVKLMEGKWLSNCSEETRDYHELVKKTFDNDKREE